LQCRWRSSDLTFACELVDVLLAHFADERGGFFFTADDHEQLIHKPKPFADEAVPAGNGVAAVVHRKKANASTPASPELIAELAKACDVVFAGSAD